MSKHVPNYIPCLTWIQKNIHFCLLPMSQSWVIDQNGQTSGFDLYYVGQKPKNSLNLVENCHKIFVSKKIPKTEYLWQHHMFHYHSNKAKYIELNQCLWDSIGSFFERKPRVLQYKNMRPFSFKSSTSFYAWPLDYFTLDYPFANKSWLRHCKWVKNIFWILVWRGIFIQLSFDPCTTFDLEYLTNAAITGPDKFFLNYSHTIGGLYCYKKSFYLSLFKV